MITGGGNCFICHFNSFVLLCYVVIWFVHSTLLFSLIHIWQMQLTGCHCLVILCYNVRHTLGITMCSVIDEIIYLLITYAHLVQTQFSGWKAVTGSVLCMTVMLIVIWERQPPVYRCQTLQWVINHCLNKKYVLWNVYLPNAVAFNMSSKYLTVTVVTLN